MAAEPNPAKNYRPYSVRHLPDLFADREDADSLRKWAYHAGIPSSLRLRLALEGASSITPLLDVLLNKGMRTPSWNSWYEDGEHETARHIITPTFEVPELPKQWPHRLEFVSPPGKLHSYAHIERLVDYDDTEVVFRGQELTWQQGSKRPPSIANTISHERVQPVSSYGLYSSFWSSAVKTVVAAYAEFCAPPAARLQDIK